MGYYNVDAAVNVIMFELEALTENVDFCLHNSETIIEFQHALRFLADDIIDDSTDYGSVIESLENEIDAIYTFQESIGQAEEQIKEIQTAIDILVD